MRKSKFRESQIVGILKEAEAGVPIADQLRRDAISKATFFKWRSKYAGATGERREAAARARRRKTPSSNGCTPT
jgi:transposase